MKKHVLLVVIAVMLIGSLLVGTYALWTKSHVQETDNIVEAGCFATEITEANVLNISNDYPISDDKGKTCTPYEITIANTCSVDAGYTALIEVLSESNMNSKYLKVQIDNNTPKVLNIYENNGTPLIAGAKESYVFATGWLKEGESVTYNIRYWIDESATLANTAGSSMKTRVVISSVAGEKPKTYCELNPSVATCQMQEMLANNHSQLIADDSVGNIRFYGQNPNNYVSFNEELWRIIGTFDVINPDSGTTETRLKIVKDESIGNYSWDSSESSVNSGYGVNEWSQADLMTTLNSGAYYNRTNGTCYNGANNTTVSCDFSLIGLNDTAKSMISRARWNLGTILGSWDSMSTTYQGKQFYSDEHSSNIGKQCVGEQFCNDTVSRTTTWDGYVGLIYPSDYVYATSGGSTYNRDACLNSVTSKWNEEVYKENCAETSWLFSGNHLWTLTPVSRSMDSSSAFLVGNTGYVGNGSALNPFEVYPVVYLKPDIKIAGGTGASTDPYQISL